MRPDSASEVIGRRIAAGLIDLVVIIVLMIVVGLAFGQGHSNAHGAGVNLHGVSIVIFLLLVFAHYAALELIWGKRRENACSGSESSFATAADPQ